MPTHRSLRRAPLTTWRAVLLGWLALLRCAQGLPAHGETGDPPTPASRPQLVVVSPDPLPFKPGDGLNTRTLVLRPPPIKGLLSWTIETRRHRGWVYAADISPDGHWLATGGLDGTIRIWDATTGEFVRALVGHDSYVYGLAWSPDGKYLASGGAFDGTAHIWEAESGRLLRTFRHTAYVSQVAWSPDGRRFLAAGGESGHILIWDTERGHDADKLEMGQPIYAIAWSPDGRNVAVGARRQAAQLVDVSLLKVRATAGLAVDDVYGVAWSPDSHFLAAATAQGTIIWDAVEGKVARTQAAAYSAAWSPDGKVLATAPSAAAVQLWNATTGEAIKTLPVSASGMTWSVDGSLLVTHTPENVTLWDVPADKVRYSIDVGSSSPQALWMPGGKLVFTGIGSGTVTAWSSRGKHLRDFAGHTAAIYAVAVTPNGKTLATASGDKTVKTWDIGSGRLLRTLEGHEGPVMAVAWSANGRSLASGGADKTVRIWNAAKGQQERVLTGHSSAVPVLSWSARSLASGGADGQVILWNANSGQQVRSLAVNTPLQSLAWSGDGKLLATGTSEIDLPVWDVATGTVVAKLERGGSPPTVSALAWSPDHPLLAAGRGNHTLQLWDLSTSKVVHDLQAMAPVLSVLWTADGKTVVAGANDRSVRSWDVATGTMRATLVVGDKLFAVVSAEGHYRAEDGADSELVYVAQANGGQTTYSPAEFAAKYHWKNVPGQVRLADE